MHNKSRFWLITLEVALTLAIVANCINMLLDTRREFLRETGLDEANLVVVDTKPFDPAFKDDDFIYSVQEEDLRQLRSFPGVADAVAIRQIPISGGGSSTSRWLMDEPAEGHGTGVPYFVVSDNALSTLGVNLVAGRDFLPSDYEIPGEDAENAEGRNIIVTQATADALFPDGNAVGQQIRNSGGEVVDTIVGVIQRMHNSWPRSEFAQNGEGLMLRPGRPSDMRRMRFMVRTEPGALESVYSELEALMRETHPGRIIEVETLTEYKMDYYQDALVMIKMLTSVIALLLVVTALGIVGLTSFSVTQRTRQIGTRRALGATKTDIVRYFLIENWMITGIGIGIGIGFTYALNYGLVHWADVTKIDLKLLALGAVALWITGVLAAVAPAVRASGVAPEIATRSV
jgi:putative ABC transport system permease protein